MASRQTAMDTQIEFQARFNAKQTRREAQKLSKKSDDLRKQITNLLKKGDTAGANQKARLLLTNQAIATQLDQAADMADMTLAQIQATNAVNRMTRMVAQSSRTMSRAQRAANPERTLLTLEQFRAQNEEYAMSNGIYQDAMTHNTSVQVSDDAVQELLGKLADDAGLELGEALNANQASKVDPVAATKEPAQPTEAEEDALQQRLRALRA